MLRVALRSRPALDPRVAPDLAQIATDEREMVVPVSLANASNPLQRVLVADVAAERVAGIRRIHDQAAGAQDLDGATDQAQLRVLGM